MSGECEHRLIHVQESGIFRKINKIFGRRAIWLRSTYGNQKLPGSRLILESGMVAIWAQEVKPPMCATYLAIKDVTPADKRHVKFLDSVYCRVIPAKDSRCRYTVWWGMFPLAR